MTIEELKAKLETVSRERDEARAEVERLTDERDKLLEAYAKAYDEWDRSKYSRAEMATAYRLGAEAMREACAGRLGSDAALTRTLAEHLEREVRNLPIPEEP